MNQDTIRRRSINIKRYFIIAAACWTLFVFLLMDWGVRQENKNTVQLALHEARTHLFEDQSLQMWVASHGGVYVPKSEHLPPNPNLGHLEERDIVTPSGRELTLVNPEYVQRLVRHNYSGVTDESVPLHHVTFTEGDSLDPWQQKAIEAFKDDVVEYYEIGGSGDNPVLHLSVLIAKKDTCVVQCHTVLNGKFQDQIGAIGVSVPYSDLYTLQKDHLFRWSISLAGVWVFGLFVLGFGAKKILHQVRETERFNDELTRQKNETLRNKVRFEAIFNSIADGIVFTDLDRRIRMINPGFTALLGYSFEEVEGQESKILFGHSEEFDLQGEERFNKGAQVDKPYFEIEYKRKDGSVFLSETLGVKVAGHDGDIVGFLGIIRDITERDTNRRNIQANNERLEVMLQLNEMAGAAEDQIVQFGLEGGVFLTSSEIGYFHFVREDQENIQLYAWSRQVQENGIIPNETNYPVEEAGMWADCIRTGQPVVQNDYQGEPERAGYPPGHTPVVRHMSVPLFDGRKIIAIVGVGNKKKPYTDLDAKQLTILAQGIVRLLVRKKEEDERQVLQSRLQQAYKMEAIGTLAGGIAHDFNNILGIIRGNADMAMDDIDEGNPARKSLERILEASKRARAIVKQILVFSRQADMSLRPVKPCELVRETLTLLRATVPTTVKIEEQLRTGGHTIMADPSQFQQVLMNLFVNAGQAMQEKGTITVTTGLVDVKDGEVFEFEKFAPGLCFFLSVTDTGVGMDEATMNRIFDPFFTTKDASEGTGMGLSIVSGIVENHGGLIRVESNPGEGTTFRIFFPLVQDEEIPLLEKVPEAMGNNERIMFVDDEEMIADMGAVMLRRLGYNVEAFSSSTKALEVFRSNPDAFDLVITDQTMPDLSGSELSAELLKIRPALPIILCTGFSKQVNRKKVREIGIREFFHKPLDKTILSNAIRRVLDTPKGDGFG